MSDIFVPVSVTRTANGKETIEWVETNVDGMSLSEIEAFLLMCYLPLGLDYSLPKSPLLDGEVVGMVNSTAKVIK